MAGFKRFLIIVALISLSQTSLAYREISGLLDNNKELSNEEINALRPLFEEMQLQYDHIISEAPQDDNKLDEQFQQMYEATLKDFQQQFTEMFRVEATTFYDATLPTVEEIMGKPDFDSMTKEQQMEFLDMQSILQDTLDDAQTNINELIAKALLLESNLLKINKPKIVMLIYNALHVGFNVAARVGRAAYCSYSHIPQLNTSLHSLYEGVDCYLYTSSLILQIQNETYQTVKTVRKNVFELASVYKKINGKNSLVGKIVSIILNVTKIARSLLETVSTATNALDRIENKLPSAALEVVNCGSNFAVQIPYMIESVSNVTECILFVDDTTKDYDFMKPEDYTREPQDLEGEDYIEEDNSVE